MCTQLLAMHAQSNTLARDMRHLSVHLDPQERDNNMSLAIATYIVTSAMATLVQMCRQIRSPQKETDYLAMHSS